jgi:DinB superfamily
MDPKLIDEYEQAGQKIHKAVAGLTPAQLNATPVPGTWSIQQIVIHIMDSDLIWADRTKRVIAEENPTLIGYDESKFAANLHYELWSVDDAITIFDLNRKNFAKVLRKLPDSALKRTGSHNEAGVLKLEDMIPREIKHVDHHLKFIHQKREMVLKGTK